MDKCTIDDLTVDANVHADVIEVENYDGSSKSYIPGRYRQPAVEDIFCSSCGEYLLGGNSNSIDEAVRKHLGE